MEYVGMLTNGLPAPLNISLVAGKETARDFYVFNEDGSKRDMRFYTFSGLVTTVEGEEYELSGSVSGAQEHCVTMQIPALPMGTHRYSLNAASDTGEIESFVSGVLGVQYPDLSALKIEPVESPTNAVIIKLPGDGGLVRALWAQTSLTQQAVMEAINAANAAEAAAAEAERSKNAALVALQGAQAFMESFNKALMQSIQVVNNYLWIGGVNTGHYLRGEDGETPRYGSDGYWYLGESRVGKARGDDGITPHITSTGYWAIGSVVTNVRAAGRDGIDGASMRRIRIYSLDELPKQEERGVYYYLKTDNGWDKYVWLHPDGWVCVGEVNDIATSEIYGLMKYGTDVQVDNGAPVGTNAEGQASVPLAGIAVAGTGKLGTATVLTEGGMVGMNAGGALMTPVASEGAFGSVKLSTSTPLTPSNSGNIGFGEAKGLRAEKASLTAFGTVKLGSQFGQSNPEPYLVGIGATSDGRLANNYAFGGALQHRKPAGWRGSMSWLDESMDANTGYFSDMYYSGLLTTEQFSQSRNGGLELLEATTELLAGVYIATGMNDERAAAVVSTGTLREVDEDIREWVSGNHYRKDEVYTQEETGAAIRNALTPYITKTDADAKYMPKNEPNLVRSGVGGIATIHKMSKSAFDALEKRDANAIYLVKRG